jgi:tRNA(Ile)-lysidine synthase
MPVLLMVSGGSDSTALLELASAYAHGEDAACDDLLKMMAHVLPQPEELELSVLHVNHMLRGDDADADERFVSKRCADLDVPCQIRRVDIAALTSTRKGGMEAVAREERYRFARMLCKDGVICTAHTLDDRIETFYMRSLVGTGPGGLSSIPRRRGNLRRPLLDATRAQLRDWLRFRHPGVSDEFLWREDASNTDGTNFRSQVRLKLIPVLRDLRPGFEKPLAQTMDLLAEEDEMLCQQAESIVYRNLSWDGETALFPREVLTQLVRPLARRVLRASLLVVNPDARLEASQIERVLDKLGEATFATEASGGIRICGDAATLTLYKAQ